MKAANRSSAKLRKFRGPRLTGPNVLGRLGATGAEKLRELTQLVCSGNSLGIGTRLPFREQDSTYQFQGLNAALLAHSAHGFDDPVAIFRASVEVIRFR